MGCVYCSACTPATSQPVLPVWAWPYPDLPERAGPGPEASSRSCRRTRRRLRSHRPGLDAQRAWVPRSSPHRCGWAACPAGACARPRVRISSSMLSIADRRVAMSERSHAPCRVTKLRLAADAGTLGVREVCGHPQFCEPDRPEPITTPEPKPPTGTRCVERHAAALPGCVDASLPTLLGLYCGGTWAAARCSPAP